MKWVKLILDFVSKFLSALWNKKRKAEFERDQHDKANDAERRVRDAVDGVKDQPDPNVKDGKVEGREDDDVFGNKGWKK